MKKVLVTGAAGTIGIRTIKYLLSEGKYDVTALDIKNNGAAKLTFRICSNCSYSTSSIGE